VRIGAIENTTGYTRASPRDGGMAARGLGAGSFCAAQCGGSEWCAGGLA
jgi:hypothetical protein